MRYSPLLDVAVEVAVSAEELSPLFGVEDVTSPVSAHRYAIKCFMFRKDSRLKLITKRGVFGT